MLRTTQLAEWEFRRMKEIILNSRNGSIEGRKGLYKVAQWNEEMRNLARLREESKLIKYCNKSNETKVKHKANTSNRYLYMKE